MWLNGFSSLVTVPGLNIEFMLEDSEYLAEPLIPLAGDDLFAADGVVSIRL